MIKSIVMASAAIILSVSAANALTLKSGEVITSGGTVAKASETANGQAKLAQDGYIVSGGVIYISAGDHVIEVPVNEIRGKSKDQIKEIIGEAAVEQMADLYDDAQAHVDEILAEGADAINAVGQTTAEIVDAINNSDALEGAIVGLTETQHEAISAALADNNDDRNITCDVGGCYNHNTGEDL